MLDPIVLDPLSIKEIDLAGVVLPDFDSGNIEVTFSGTPMMVTCQVSVFSLANRVGFESREADMMDFKSTNLNGILWLPDAKAQGFLAITNASKNQVTVQLTVGPMKKEVQLYSRQTDLLNLNDEFSQNPPGAALVQLQQNGLPGDVIAAGFVLDLSDGYSSAFFMPDPAVAGSSKLAGAHFRFGQPDPSEDFPTGTQFLAPLLLANVGTNPVAAHVSVDYTVNDSAQTAQGQTTQQTSGSGSGSTPSQPSKGKPIAAPSTTTQGKLSVVVVKDLTIAPGSLQNIELSHALAGLGVTGPVEEAGVEITYDGPPGTLIGQLTSLDQTGDYSFEVPIKDPTATIGGAYPWTIENGANTVLHLKNTTDQSATAYVVIDFGNATYNPDRIVLAPYQTAAIDVQKLKDMNKPDVRNQAFPADAKVGRILWHEKVAHSVIGRAEQVNLAAGIAKSFSCGGDCNCPWNGWATFWVTPYSLSLTLGGGDYLYPYQRFEDCNKLYYGPYLYEADYWDNSDSSVASLTEEYGYCEMDALDSGLTTATAYWANPYYEEPDCIGTDNESSQGAGVTVICGDAIDTLIAEYSTPSAYQPTSFVPQCSDFTGSASSTHYSFSNYNQDDTGESYSAWAILRSSLLTGIEATVTAYGSAPTMNSGYRSPLVNYNLETSLGITHHPNERHLHGDAADLDDSHNSTVWSALDYIGKNVISPIACVEPHDAGYSHFHEDWRGTCPSGW